MLYAFLGALLLAFLGTAGTYSAMWFRHEYALVQADKELREASAKSFNEGMTVGIASVRTGEMRELIRTVEVVREVEREVPVKPLTKPEIIERCKQRRSCREHQQLQ